MSMARVPLPGVETKGSNAASETFGLKDTASPTSMSNTQKHILQIIRNEEDHLMSLLAASPLLSSLFLTYANRATAPDNPPIPSPIDQELLEIKALNHRLQEEVASLRDQLTKGTDRAREAQDCIEALRARLSSVEDTNRDLEAAVLDERAKVKAITSEYADYKKETTDTIAELHNAMDKEVDARAAPSQAIGDQQITPELPKEKTKHPSPPPAATQHRPKSGGEREQQRSDVSASEKGKEAVKQTDTRKQQGDSERSADTKPLDNSKQGDCIDHPDEKKQKDTHGDLKESIKPAYGSTSVQNVKQSPLEGRKLQPASIWFRGVQARRQRDVA